MKKIIDKAFEGIRLDESSHKYYLNGKPLKASVSAFIGKFKNPFDVDKIAPMTAKKTGKTVEEVKAMWKEAGRFSCMKGTAIHGLLEDLVDCHNMFGAVKIDGIKKRDDGGYTIKEDEIKYCVDLISALGDRCEEMIPEVTLYGELEGELYGGQADLLVKTKKGKYIILDYKTNKELKSDGFNGQTMKGKFKFLQDANVMHYTIQMNAYRKFIEDKTNIKIDEMFLIHLGGEKPEFIKCDKVNVDTGIYE